MVRRTLALLVLAGVFATGPALADDPKDPKDKDKAPEVIAPSAGSVASGRTALREGLALREQGNTEAALGRLQSAWDFIPTPITGFELGKTHLMLGHVLAAHELFAKVGRLKVSPEESSRSQTARDEAARLMKEVEPRLPSLLIKVTLPASAPNATAEVKVDDEKVPLTNGENKLHVEVGPHDVIAKAGDGPEQKVHVEIAEAETKDVVLTPQWVAPAPKPVLGPGGQVIYVRQTNPLTFIGFGTAAAALIVTVVSAVVFVDARKDADDRCGNNYCPPTNPFVGQPRVVFDREFDSAQARSGISGITMVASGLIALVMGGVGAVFAVRPIKERVTAINAPAGRGASSTSKPPATTSVFRPSIRLGGSGLEGTF